MSADFRKLTALNWSAADLLCSERMALNEALVSEYLSNEAKRKVIDHWIGRAIYTHHEQQRKAGRDEEIFRVILQ